MEMHKGRGPTPCVQKRLLQRYRIHGGNISTHPNFRSLRPSGNQAAPPSPVAEVHVCAGHQRHGAGVSRLPPEGRELVEPTHPLRLVSIELKAQGRQSCVSGAGLELGGGVGTMGGGLRHTGGDMVSRAVVVSPAGPSPGLGLAKPPHAPHQPTY